MSFELTSNAPPADWQQFQELFRETEYTDDSNNHFNYCTICLYIIPDLAQAKFIDAPVRDCINKTLNTNIELGGLICGYCYDNYAKSTTDQASWPIAEDDLMSIDDTLFDPEKEQLDQAQVKHHLAVPGAINSNAKNGNNGHHNSAHAIIANLPELYTVETSEFFHSHESDSHVLNYSEHEYDTSHVTDHSGISDLSAVLPVDVTFSAPAQLYPPHVTPHWTDHVTNHVTDQRVTPVKRRDLNEIAGMKLPELKTELKRYRLSTKGTKPQLVQRLFRHLSLFHTVSGHVPDNAPFIFADLQDTNEAAQPWSVSRDRPNESLTALFEDDQLAQESYLAHKISAQISHQARDTQPLDLSQLSLLSLPEIKARLAQYTGASIKGSKAELIQRLVRYSCLFGNAHK
eukprot:TRINITY_DN1854_c0_g1_i1.p1 TRINITY_DN1854_c0_g1~~TRINITY_DN1854_c0_g1_i1.p1  ORF type:complete len:402 (-),score=160.48 TRINITY_DN1854_c0_g1_i1:59-1264(-)